MRLYKITFACAYVNDLWYFRLRGYTGQSHVYAEVDGRSRATPADGNEGLERSAK